MDIRDQFALSNQMADQARKRNNPAGFMLDRLMNQIIAFQLLMSDDAEIGITVIGGGSNGTFHLRTIIASNPDMLVFTGFDVDGRKVTLVQHHSQMSVMFVEMTKLEEKPYRIGFTPSE